MGVDFDTLVLAPSQDVFSIPVTAYPVASLPKVRSYAARGIFSYNVFEIPLDDGSKMTSVTITLSIRLKEFPANPTSGDQILIKGTLYIVDRATPDGQGASKLTLKTTSPVVTAGPVSLP